METTPATIKSMKLKQSRNLHYSSFAKTNCAFIVDDMVIKTTSPTSVLPALLSTSEPPSNSQVQAQDSFELGSPRAAIANLPAQLMQLGEELNRLARLEEHPADLETTNRGIREVDVIARALVRRLEVAPLLSQQIDRLSARAQRILPGLQKRKEQLSALARLEELPHQLPQIVQLVETFERVGFDKLTHAERMRVSALRHQLSNSLGGEAAVSLTRLIVPTFRSPGGVRFEQTRYVVDNELPRFLLNRGLKMPHETTDLVDRATANHMAATGLRPISNVQFANEQLPEVVAALQKMAARKGVFYVTIEKHAMLVATDPAKNIYRFFDPNFGVVRFSSASEFAEQVTYYTHWRYNKSPFSPYARALSSGPSQPAGDTMFSNIELPLSQSMGGWGVGFEEVCGAMSCQMARFLLQNTDLDRAITTEMLGIQDWDMLKLVPPALEKQLSEKQYIEVRDGASMMLSLVFSSRPNKELSALYTNATDACAARRYDDALAMVNKALSAEPGRGELRMMRTRILAEQFLVEHPAEAAVAEAVAAAEAPQPTADFFIEISELVLRN